MRCYCVRPVAGFVILLQFYHVEIIAEVTMTEDEDMDRICLEIGKAVIALQQRGRYVCVGEIFSYLSDERFDENTIPRRGVLSRAMNLLTTELDD
ncbi:hypothetical protein M942_13105 [Enterobacter ludwigii]|nr:hypothetical protein M942_13105 [Enterobacter ludwigii]